MKILLACLMCIVLVASECFAIDGGPDYGGTGSVRVTGIYAGLFVPTIVDNSLGIFTATIPRTGVGSGTVALFRNGIFYPGTIQAIADPDSAVLTGVVSSTFDITFTSEEDADGNTTSLVVTYNANGSIKGRIRANTNLFSTAAARIKGNAAITYKTVGGVPDPDANSVGPVPYRVKAFKQSEVQ